MKNDFLINLSKNKNNLKNIYNNQDLNILLSKVKKSNKKINNYMLDVSNPYKIDIIEELEDLINAYINQFESVGTKTLKKDLLCGLLKTLLLKLNFFIRYDVIDNFPQYEEIKKQLNINNSNKHSGDYGDEWIEQRKKALERDNYTCQVCGKNPKDLGQNPDVHHIIPYRKSKNNSLENLITLCRKHHLMCENNKIPIPNDDN